MWLGTRDGLNQFDGNRTRVFKPVIGDSLSIAGNYINNITEGKNGDLWIAHNKGISNFNRKGNHFQNITLGTQGSDHSEMRFVANIENRIWACGRSGIYVYDTVNGILKHPDFLSDGIKKMSVNRIKFQPDGSIWLATSGKGLIRLQKEGTAYQTTARFLPGLRVEDVLFHTNGKIYAATYENGVYECDADGNILRTWFSKEGDLSRVNNTRTIIQDKKQQIWVGGFQGIGIIDPGSAVYTMVTGFHGLEEDVAPSIRSMMVDRNGSIWAGTYHNGAILYDNYLSRFKTHFLRSGDGPTGIVSAFAYTPKQETYVGTESGFLIKYNNKSQKLRQWQIKDQLQGIVIKSLYYDTLRSQLWIGTLRNGLYVLKDNSSLQKVTLNTQTQFSWADLGVINHITTAPEGLWLLTDRSGGLNFFSPETQTIKAFANQDQLHKVVGNGSGKYILPIDPNSYLVATHQSGLVYFDNTTEGRVEKIEPQISDVNHICFYNNQYFVSTQGLGLVVFNKELQQARRYAPRDGLLNNTVLSAFVIGNDHLWVNTLNGISSFSKGKFTNFHIRNGFPIAEINNGAYLQTTDSLQPFLIGGKNAWVGFNQASLYTNPYGPPVFITDMKVSNRSINSIEGLHDINLLHTDMLTLSHSQSTLSFEFSGLNYFMPRNNSYRYMLEDFDKEWRYADYRGIAEYSQIPSGKYRFRVQAANNDGVWGKDDYQLMIKINPPFWETWLAYLLYGLIITGGILVIRRNAIKSARLKHNLYLKDLEQEKADLAHQLKVKYFTDISHEIRTPLTLILSPIDEMLDSPDLKEDDKKRIKSIQYHGRSLMLLVNQLLEINRVELNKEKLNPVPVVLKDVCFQMNDAFASLAAQVQIKWSVETLGAAEVALMMDKEKLEKIVLNLLTNAFKYTGAGGEVHLRMEVFKEDSYRVKIEVADTGRGISEEELPHIFERFFKGKESVAVGTGIGLSLVKAVVEDLMQGTITVQSKKGSGTRFTVILNQINPASSYPGLDEGWQLAPEYMPQTELREMDAKDDKNIPMVLVVEDNPDLRIFLEDKLSKIYRVLAVETAEDALSVMLDEDVDMVVSDVMLPGMNGKDLCARIKSDVLTSHIPVLLLTAMQSEQHKLDSLDIGADDYLTKPFVFKELHLRIQNILKQRERWRGLYKTKSILPEKATERFSAVDEQLLQDIELQVDKHLSDAEYSVEQLGKDVGLSRVHLYRKLKKLTGLTPSQFLRNTRLRKSIDILAVEDIRVSDLAFRVGFNDPNYFIRCFKELFGVSPTEYVKQ